MVNLSSVIAIAAGEFHSVALLANGEVYTFGRGNSGQLGHGAWTTSLSPVLVATNAKAIAAGLNHTLVVRTDGSVYATGLNGNGQLGNNSQVSRNVFAAMTNISNAVAVAGGARHSVILLSDGTLKAVGDNTGGQVGDGTTAPTRTLPVAVSTLTNVMSVVAGNDHTLARTSDGATWSWGLNTFGQIGDGSTEPLRRVPTAVPGLGFVTEIGVGHHHSVAVSAEQIVYTWGRNNNSQLGGGVPEGRWAPVAISGASYNWRAATPAFSPGTGTYVGERTVVVTSATTGATIHYTVNGAEPTETDPTVASGGTVLIAQSLVLKAKAWKTGVPESETGVATYTLKVATPTVSPAATTYTTPKTVTMATATSGATLRYTTDGSQPTSSSTLYEGAITIEHTTTLKIVAFKSGWVNSDTLTAHTR